MLLRSSAACSRRKLVLSIGSRQWSKIPPATCHLPVPIVRDCRDRPTRIDEKTKRIALGTKALRARACETGTARRLQTMPRAGQLTAVAVEAFAPDMAQFSKGRDFAAWLGLGPRQDATGGKARLGRLSKAGQSDIRRLPTIGAMARITGRARQKIPAQSGIGRMPAKTPRLLVALARANRMARQIWARLNKGEEYRDPAAVASAWHDADQASPAEAGVRVR